MAILNYTTQIAAEKTVTEIQSILAKAGAQAILTEYDANGVLCAMSFRVVIPGDMLTFRLPANIDKVFECIKKEKKVPHRLKTKEQASRVAWRILKDWIEAQMAIIEAQCAELTQVFLPYAQDNTGQTLYDRIKGNGFLQLSAPKGQ
jgi:hypothetical protein